VTLRLLRHNPAFRRLFLAHAVSRAGDIFNMVALVVLVFQLTGSGLGVAGTVAFEVLPVLLLGPVAGLLVDRYPRRTLLVAADCARAGLVLPLVVVSDSVALAYGVAFALSACTQVFNPAASATLPDLVEPEDLVDANALLWTVAVLAQIVLAPLAGGLIALYGTGFAFAINAASYLLSAGLLVGLQAGRAPGQIARLTWRAALAGVAAVRAHPLLARLAVGQVLAALSAGATSGLLVVLAGQQLGVGPEGFGLLLGAIAVGAAGGPLLGRRFIRAGERRWLFGPYLLRAGVDITLALTGSLWLVLPALTLYGVATSTGMIAYQATLQREVPGEARGRVFALYDILWNGARLVSLGLGGVLADTVGIRSVYLLGGFLLTAAFLAGTGRSLPTTRGARPARR
jgi:MFS family permease